MVSILLTRIFAELVQKFFDNFFKQYEIWPIVSNSQPRQDMSVIALYRLLSTSYSLLLNKLAVGKIVDKRAGHPFFEFLVIRIFEFFTLF